MEATTIIYGFLQLMLIVEIAASIYEERRSHRIRMEELKQKGDSMRRLLDRLNGKM